MRGSEANCWVAAVTEENKKGEEPLGRCHPTPGIGGCWEPRVHNEPLLSKCTYSVSLVRKTPAMRDVSQPGWEERICTSKGRVGASLPRRLSSQDGKR